MQFARVLGQSKRGFRCTERRDRIKVIFGNKADRELDGYVLVKLNKGTVVEETTHFRGRIVKGWQPEWLAKRNMVGGVKVPHDIVELPTSMDALLAQVEEGTLGMDDAAKLLPKLQKKAVEAAVKAEKEQAKEAKAA